MDANSFIKIENEKILKWGYNKFSAMPDDKKFEIWKEIVKRSIPSELIHSGEGLRPILFNYANTGFDSRAVERSGRIQSQAVSN